MILAAVLACQMQKGEEAQRAFILEVGRAWMERAFHVKRGVPLRLQRVGPSWGVSLQPPETTQDDVLWHDRALAFDDDGRMIAGSVFGIEDTLATMKGICLTARARDAQGRWHDVLSLLNHSIPAIAPTKGPLQSVSNSPLALKLWNAVGDTYLVFADGGVMQNGRTIGALAHPIELPALRIPKGRVPAAMAVEKPKRPDRRN